MGEDAAATGLDAADTPDEGGTSEEGLLRKRRPRPRRWNELSMAPWRQSGVRGTEHKCFIAIANFTYCMSNDFPVLTCLRPCSIIRKYYHNT